MKISDDVWAEIKAAGDAEPLHRAPFAMANVLNDSLSNQDWRMTGEDFRQFLGWMLASDETSALMVLETFYAKVYEGAQ